MAVRGGSARRGTAPYSRPYTASTEFTPPGRPFRRPGAGQRHAVALEHNTGLKWRCNLGTKAETWDPKAQGHTCTACSSTAASPGWGTRLRSAPCTSGRGRRTWRGFRVVRNSSGRSSVCKAGVNVAGGGDMGGGGAAGGAAAGGRRGSGAWPLAATEERAVMAAAQCVRPGKRSAPAQAAAGAGAHAQYTASCSSRRLLASECMCNTRIGAAAGGANPNLTSAGSWRRDACAIMQANKNNGRRRRPQPHQRR